MKVVQWTVSYAPGGRSLRDVNAKTKVTARAIIYTTPAGKIEIKTNTILSSQIVKRVPKNIGMGTAVIATLEIRQINNSRKVGDEKAQAIQ